MPTGIWSSRWRSGCAHWDLDCEEEAAGEEAEEAEEAEEEENSSDKSNNPHLAGGEKTKALNMGTHGKIAMFISG